MLPENLERWGAVFHNRNPYGFQGVSRKQYLSRGDERSGEAGGSLDQEKQAFLRGLRVWNGLSEWAAYRLLCEGKFLQGRPWEFEKMEPTSCRFYVYISEGYFLHLCPIVVIDVQDIEYTGFLSSFRC